MLLDDRSNRASDAGYEPGDNLRKSYQPVDPQDDSQSYPSMNTGQEINPDTDSFDSNNPTKIPSELEESGYNSANKENFSDPAFQDAKKQQEKRRLIEEAQRLMKRGQARAFNTVPKKIGEALGDKQMFKTDTVENRNKAKEAAQKKAREFAKDEIGKRIADKGLKTGFRKGMSQGAGKAAKSAGKAAGKAIGKGVAKAGAQAAGKVGAAAAVEGGVAVAGAATGAVTFGLGFVLSMLLDIAISLGISDAVDAAFELKAGNVKHAIFLAIRAAYKVMMFIYLLVTILLLLTVAGMIIAIPMLVVLNLYMIAGFAFRNIPHLQGLVWWEIAIIILMDLFAFLILMGFLAAMGWYLCGQAGLSAGIPGLATSLVVRFYDWWTGFGFCEFVGTGVI